MAVNGNVSRSVAASSHSTSGAQMIHAIRASAGGSETGTVTEYSRIGSSYENIDSRRQQSVAGRNQVSDRLSERYEFSEAHLTMSSAGSSGIHGQGETAMQYEVPLTLSQCREHKEYSYLQH